MFANRVKETTTTEGTGNLTLLGAEANHATINAKFGLNRRFNYWVVHGTTAFEVGVGYLSASNTLVRETVKDNSLGTTALINFTSGTKTVRVSPSASMLIPALPTIRNPSGLGKLMLPFNVGVSEGNSVTLTADRLYLKPIMYVQGGLVSALKTYVVTGAAGTKARMGLYELAADGAPGRLIVQSNDISTVSSGMQSASAIANAPVMPGWYYLAIIASGAVAFNPYETLNYNVGATPAGTTSSGNAHKMLYDDIAAGWTVLPNPPTIDGSVDLRMPNVSLEYTDA